MTRGTVVAVLLVALMGVAATTAADEPLAKLVPKDAALYAEARAPAEALKLTLDWLKKYGWEAGLNGGITHVADELKMTPKELGVEVGKFKGAAAFSAKVGGEGSGALIIDLGASTRVREGVAKAMVTEAPGTVATVNGITIYGDNKLSVFVAGQRFAMGSLDAVKQVAERVGRPDVPSLADAERYGRAVATLDAKTPVFACLDVQVIRKSMLAAAGRKWEVRSARVMDAVFDLATIDTLVLKPVIVDKTTLVSVTILLNAENRTRAAFRSKTAARSVERFYTKDCKALLAATLVDGKAQWKAFAELVARVSIAAGERNDFVEIIGQVEEALETKIADELANVTELAVGVSMPAGLEGAPDVLFALRVKDVARMRRVMSKVEAVAKGEGELAVRERKVGDVVIRHLLSEEADSDYAYAFVDDYVLGSNHVRGIENAVKAWQAKKSILDDDAIRKALAGMHQPNGTLLLVNIQGMLPMMPVGGPGQWGPVALTVVDSARHIDVRADPRVVVGLGASYFFLYSFRAGMRGMDDDDEMPVPDDMDIEVEVEKQPKKLKKAP